MRTLLACFTLTVALQASAASVNQETHDIDLKLVYVSTAPTAGSANLEYVSFKTNPSEKPVPGAGPAVALDLHLGEIRGFKVHVHMFAAGRRADKAMLKGADGVVFVADGDPKHSAQNLAAFTQLKADVAASGLEWKSLSFAVQVASDGTLAPVSPEEACRQLGLTGVVAVASVPTTGVGVFDTLKAVTKQMLGALRGR